MRGMRSNAVFLKFIRLGGGTPESEKAKTFRTARFCRKNKACKSRQFSNPRQMPLKRCAYKILSIRMVQICSTGYIYKGNYLYLCTLLIYSIESMQNLLEPLLNPQETFKIIWTFFRSPRHFPYHPDTFSYYPDTFLDHPEIFSRFSGHLLDRQETFQIIWTLLRSAGHIF